LTLSGHKEFLKEFNIFDDARFYGRALGSFGGLTVKPKNHRYIMKVLCYSDLKRQFDIVKPTEFGGPGDYWVPEEVMSRVAVSRLVKLYVRISLLYLYIKLKLLFLEPIRNSFRGEQEPKLHIQSGMSCSPFRRSKNQKTHRTSG
jgi:hypothetical protein